MTVGGRDLSWLLDIDDDLSFSRDITSLVVVWESNQRIDWHSRVQRRSVFEVLVDRLSGAWLTAEVPSGRAMRVVDTAGGGFDLHTGYIYEVEETSHRYLAVRCKGISEHLHFTADMGLYENLLGIDIARDILSRNAGWLPYPDVGLGYVDESVVGSATVGADDLSIAGGSDVRYEVFDNYASGAGGLQRGTLLGVLGVLAQTELGWIHETGSGGFRMRSRGETLRGFEPRIEVDNVALRHERFLTRDATSYIRGGHFSYSLLEDELLLSFSDYDIPRGRDTQVFDLVQSGSRLLYRGGLRIEAEGVGPRTLQAYADVDRVSITTEAEFAMKIESLRLYGDVWRSEPEGIEEVFTGDRGGDTIFYRGRSRSSEGVKGLMNFFGQTLSLARRGIRSVTYRDFPGAAYGMLDGVRSRLFDGTPRDYLITGIGHSFDGSDGKVQTEFELLPALTGDFAYVGQAGHDEVGRVVVTI